MLTIEKVNEARADRERRGLAAFRIIAASLAASAASLIAVIFVYRSPAGGTLDVWDANRAFRLLLLAPWAAICLALARQAYHMMQARRDPRLRCPHCERSFSDVVRLVVATRNCPHCGHRILAEPIGPDGPPPPMGPSLGLEA